MTFADVIRQRVRTAMHHEETRFRPVLDELAVGLTTDDVVAAIVPGGVGGRVYLTLWPRSRPASRHLMLAFWITDASIRVFTDPPRELHDVGELEACLVEFVSAPPFLETLDLLRRMNRQPVDAYLRAHGAGVLSARDVVVSIPADEQRRLAELPDGADVVLVVEVSGASHGARFDPQSAYPALESDGVRVDVARVDGPRGPALHVAGTKARSIDLTAEFDDFDEEVRAKMSAPHPGRDRDTRTGAQNMTRGHIMEVVTRHLVEAVDGLKPEDIDPKRSMRDLGANDLDIAEVVSSSMRELGVKIPRSELSKLTNLDGFVDLLEATLRGAPLRGARAPRRAEP